MHVHWIADPNAPDDAILELTVDQFKTFSSNLFELQAFKTYSNHPACKVIREL